MSGILFGSQEASEQIRLDRLTRLLEAEAISKPFQTIAVNVSTVEMSRQERVWAIDRLVYMGNWERFYDDFGEYARPVRWLYEDMNL